MTADALCIEIKSSDSVRRLPLPPEGPVWLGREASCHILLEAPDVSRRHARLDREPAGVRLTDCSANGTRVGDDVLHGSSVALQVGGSFRIGPFRLQVQPEHAGAAEQPSERDEAAPRREVDADVRRALRRQLIEHVDLNKLDHDGNAASTMRPEVVGALQEIMDQEGSSLPEDCDRAQLVQELADEAVGLGPLEQLLHDPKVSEIMVVDPNTIFVERGGRLERTPLHFTDDDSVRAVIERVVTLTGRRIDESTPLVDARLADGSRVNAVIPPLAIKGSCITIRKFPTDSLSIDDLVRFGSLNERVARFLERAVRIQRNIVISGGTGSGKTTLLNVLSAAIPDEERIVTIEDAAELRLSQSHVVSLESRPANLEGKGALTIRDLLRNALRMRPDRIIVGECRGGEALDMLQAMNTGHEGSMTTTHANSPRECLTRIETLCLMAGLDLPITAIRAQAAQSLHLIVQQSRLSDGSRRVVSVAEVLGVDERGEVALREIFSFRRTGTDADGRVHGELAATGYLPSFVDRFVSHGLVDDGDVL